MAVEFTDEELIRFIEEHPDWTLEEIGAHFYCWSRTIYVHMKRLGIKKPPAKRKPISSEKTCVCGGKYFAAGYCKKHYSWEYKKKLKDEGKCIECGEPNDRSGPLCTWCRKKRRISRAVLNNQ